MQRFLMYTLVIMEHNIQIINVFVKHAKKYV
jgi:hypothetical protein